VRLPSTGKFLEFIDERVILSDMEDRNTNDPVPTTREGVLEEIDYWQQRVGYGQPGSPREQQVKQRLETLYVLLQHYSSPPPSPPSPPPQEQSRRVLVIRDLLRGIPYIGNAIDTAIFGKE
jgi:hypothetical protein